MEENVFSLDTKNYKISYFGLWTLQCNFNLRILLPLFLFIYFIYFGKEISVYIFFCRDIPGWHTNINFQLTEFND